MNSGGEIEEDIVEEIEEELYSEDEDLKEDVDITDEIKNGAGDLYDAAADGEEEEDDNDDREGESGEIKFKNGAGVGKVNEFAVDVGSNLRTKDYLVIEKFSNKLAESLITEALLINDIYENDKINVSEKKTPKARTCVLKDLGRSRTGDLNEQRAGFDSYLIEKFLHSKADPIEVNGELGFDGKEDYFQTDTDHTYPGLDKDDEYAQGVSRSVTGMVM